MFRTSLKTQKSHSGKKEIVISIPGKTNDAHLLNSRKPHTDVKNEIIQFLQSHMKNDASLSSRLALYLNDVVANAYDAYCAVDKAKQDKKLVIKVSVTQDHEGRQVIKIKDNGSGFINKPKSQRFIYQPNPADSASYAKKDENMLGGQRLGLGLFCQTVEKSSEAYVEIKNRKDKGATIYIIYRKKSTPTSIPSSSLFEEIKQIEEKHKSTRKKLQRFCHML